MTTGDLSSMRSAMSWDEIRGPTQLAGLAAAPLSLKRMVGGVQKRVKRSFCIQSMTLFTFRSLC